ncbi:MAG: hypothetical protein ACN4GZ_17870 [Acidimicrobiales bacterium]
MMNPHFNSGATLLVAVSLFAGACSASTSATEGVATLEDSASGQIGDAAAAATLEDAEPVVDAEQAALDFSACMREEGVDFPDLGVNADGGLNLRQGFEGIDRRSDEVQAALETCRPLIEAAGFGGGRRAGIVENVEIQDALVEFSACLRDAGFDVGDLELGVPPGAGGGQAQGADGAGAEDGEQRGQGRGQGGFGDRNARFADQLGLDYEDPDVAASVDGCATVIDDAFTAAGVGEPGERP